MCDCGCEAPNSAGYGSYKSANVQSFPGMRNRDRTRGSPLRPNTFIDARKTLTYDDEDDDYKGRQQCYPPSSSSAHARPLRSPAGFPDLSKVPGLAIVQRPMTNLNGSMDYAGAVRRENFNSRSSGSQKYRAALPPRGRTPCCQDEQPSPKIRGRCQPSRHSDASQKYAAASQPRVQTTGCLDDRSSRKARGCCQYNHHN